MMNNLLKTLLTLILLLSISYGDALSWAQDNASSGYDQDAENVHVDDQPKVLPHKTALSIINEIASESSDLMSAIKVPEKTYQLHDIIKVQIVESATADNSTTSSSEREFTVKAALEAYPAMTSGGGLLPKFVNSSGTVKPELKMKSSTERENEGDQQKKDSLRGTISVTVADIKPNGTMVITGSKEILVNEETHYLRLTGLISKEDINFNNTISSSNIADLKIEYIGSGPVTDAAKRGVMGKIFDAIWPF